MYVLWTSYVLFMQSFALELICRDCSTPVFITTNSSLVDDNGNQLPQCENSTIIFTCITNSTIGEPIYQWLSSLDYETFDKGLSIIKVELRPYPVNYSCVVTDDYTSGYANITVSGYGE